MVNLDDPLDLGFEYVRRIARGIDQIGTAGEAVSVIHLGAGALTLARYLEATRPGSRQQVIELEPDLIELVRESAPLPRGANIRVRYGDAREMLSRLPKGLHGSADVIIIDIFSGARTPAHVASVEFYEAVRAYVRPGGMVAVNIADGPGLAFARRQAAALCEVWAEVVLTTETSILKGRRFGNVVAFASALPLPFDSLPRILRSDPVPSVVVEGPELSRFIAGVNPARDVSATPSPLPARSVFVSRG